jgi:hypothetical protein
MKINMDEKLLLRAWTKAWSGGYDNGYDNCQGSETNRFDYSLDDEETAFRKFMDEIKNEKQ